MDKIRILIVDDESSLRLGVKGILADEGYEVEEAQTGEDAIEKIRAAAPHLVLQDVNMGAGMKGFDVCRRIKANPKTRQIGVIMLTADSEKGTVVECVEAGADDYLLKPYDAAKLLHRVRRILPKATAAVEGDAETSEDTEADSMPDEQESQGDSAPAAPPVKIKKPVSSVMRTKRR